MNIDNNEKLRFIDLCCGIGGFHQALTNLNLECVFACDIDKHCIENYKLNYGITPAGDINNLNIENIPNFDILCAGFPCQPFSKAGYRNGFNDDRSNIFFTICNIIEYHRPKYIILENVKNLKTHDNSNTWNTIRDNINNLNYNTYENPIILNSLYYGVPQNRERAIILCKRHDLGELPNLPLISRLNIKNTSLKDIIDDIVDSKYNINDKAIVVHSIWNEFLNLLNNNQISIPKFPIWTDWWDDYDDIVKPDKDVFYNKYKNIIDKNTNFYITNKKILEKWLYNSRQEKLWAGSVRKLEWQVGENGLNMDQVLYSLRSSGVRAKKINYSPTLVAMASMIPIYGPKKRHLTPRECARLQSFPENYIIHPNDKISYKQFGNSVNIKMIEKSVRFLLYNENLV